ncbi:MAG: helix-turn-helix domain-containing protein [Ilumatobacteraceae bacterium]
MTRPSPQTDRIRWIVDLLAQSPQKSFTLAQIARHVGVAKATVVPALAALTSAGWLIRHPVRKTYRLGPALVDIGRAAEHATVPDDTSCRLVELSAATGAASLLWQVSDDELVLTEIVTASGPRPNWAGLRRGHCLKPHAPTGAALVAWGDDDRIEQWMTRDGAIDLGVARERIWPGLAAARRNGFVVELQDRMQFQLIHRLRSSGAVDDLVEAVSFHAGERLAELDYLAAAIDPDASYWPLSINSAVFDRYGEAELIVCAVDVAGPVDGREVVRIGALVREASRQLTAANRGTTPPSFPAAP